MAKGLFSQVVCLLTDGRTTIEAVKSALQEKEFEIVKQAPPQKDWRFGGPTLVVAYDPEVNGYIAVDVVNQPWPDSMGDPKTDSKTFAAWSMGHFGPFAFPGGLARAAQHSYAWEGGRTLPQTHRGFIRIRLSYGFGAKDDAKILPEDYDPLAEMIVLSRMVLPLLKLPGVLCYFNPNGEVLRDRAGFREHWVECKKQEKIPLALWMNIRFVHVNDRFWFMDTVGNGQLDLQDVEAVFTQGQVPGGRHRLLLTQRHLVPAGPGPAARDRRRNRRPRRDEPVVDHGGAEGGSDAAAPSGGAAVSQGQPQGNPAGPRVGSASAGWIAAFVVVHSREEATGSI